jgi:hypothetical protein
MPQHRGNQPIQPLSPQEFDKTYLALKSEIIRAATEIDT